MKNAKKELSPLIVIFIAAAACLIYAINGGIRANYGMIRSAITAKSGVPYETVSFVLAVAQLSFGVMQPVFGALALKRSNGLVLSVGAGLAIVGLATIPACGSVWSLLLFLGILLPAGLGALSFGVIMGAVTPALGEKRAALVSGLVSASSGIGSMVFSPLLLRLLQAHGLRAALLALCVPTAILIPVGIWLSGFSRRETVEESAPILPMVGAAFQDRSYRLLTLAFFTCGFHMAIIETHLYSHITSLGFAENTAALAFSIYGVATLLGSIFSGAMISRFSMKNTLAAFFGSRTLIITAFLLLPKSHVSVYLFAALLGFTGSSTVPPTSGLVQKLFGTKKLAVLFGVAFVAHQIGAFFSAWLGGLCLRLTGGYSLIWLVSAFFAAAAALCSFLVKES